MEISTKDCFIDGLSKIIYVHPSLVEDEGRKDKLFLKSHVSGITTSWDPTGGNLYIPDVVFNTKSFLEKLDGWVVCVADPTKS